MEEGHADPVDHRIDDFRLVIEVPVHRTACDAGTGRDRFQAGARDARLQQAVLGRVKDALAGFLCVFLGFACHRFVTRVLNTEVRMVLY